MKNITIDSPSKFIAKVQSLTDSFRLPLWYRGHGSPSYKLLPSLYRTDDGNGILEIEIIMKREIFLMERFRQRSIPYINSTTISQEMDYLFSMQHHGIPTRLLDWTESPQVALFFAVMGAKRNNFTKPCHIYVVNPGKWNKLFGKVAEEKVFSLHGGEGDSLALYYPRNFITQKPVPPLAIYGDYNNTRIIAQKGTFMLFGTETKPLEEYDDRGEDKRNIMSRLIIPAEKGAIFYDAILSLGVTESTIFPDLGGLASELTREVKAII